MVFVNILLYAGAGVLLTAKVRSDDPTWQMPGKWTTIAGAIIN